MVCGLGYFTAIVQQFTILSLKDNVFLSISHLVLELTVVVIAAICFVIYT